MAGKFKLFRSILILLNAGIIISYLITCLSPFVNTAEDWYLAFPGLVFPLLFFALVLFIFIWLFLKSRWWVMSLIVLLMGFQQIFTAFAFHIPKDFSYEKRPNTLRILQWNVSGWDEHYNYNKDNNGNSYWQQMMDLVKQQNADVLCFEEFFDPVTVQNYEPNIATIINIGYPYHYFVATEYYKNEFESGIAIFSKYPMIDSTGVAFEKDKAIGEHLLYADIKVQDKIFRIFATHLQSVHFQQKEYESLSNIKHAHESGFRDSRNIISKLKKGYISRYKQAKLVSEKIKESPYQSLICGDFNDVPNSSTYFKVKGNLQDAFLQKGFFIGRTFRFISPTLRIDYILADKKFKVTQFQRIKVPYSDHYAIETDLEY
ncbi:MAG TPA: endonuclease/exonuclease/phosphatase family protein [Ginsengibacter sp.]|nr:endonuclease/exonuclease/phosphatase family protein [Ginsengibacter sp.]